MHRLVKYVVERNTAFRRYVCACSLIHAAMLGDEVLRAKLIDRYAAFERLIAEKIAERTDAVSADYLTQLILLASDGMIVQRRCATITLTRPPSCVRARHICKRAAVPRGGSRRR